MYAEDHDQTMRINTMKVEWRGELNPNERLHLNGIRNMMAKHAWRKPRSVVSTELGQGLTWVDLYIIYLLNGGMMHIQEAQALATLKNRCHSNAVWRNSKKG